MRLGFRKRRGSKGRERPSLAYPYYVDARGLRVLADSLAIELPVARERKRQGRLAAQARGVGGERGWEEGSHFEGHIHLNDLAMSLLQSNAYREIVDVLGLIPQVHDRGVLDAALSHIENMPGEESAETVAERLRAAYALERTREVVSAKRRELEQVALQNQLVILRGTFETTEIGDRTCVRLTHLEPAKVVPESTDTPEEEFAEIEVMPMPEEVGIEAVLPAPACLTEDGRERLGRGAPFYGRLIGHSASYDAGTGILTCSAYAVWGMPRPQDLLDQPHQYDFLEGK